MFFDERQFASRQHRPTPPSPTRPYDPEQPWLSQMIDQLHHPQDPQNPEDTHGPQGETHYTRQELKRVLKNLVTTLYNKTKEPVSAEALFRALNRMKGTVYVEVDIKLIVSLMDTFGYCVSREPPHRLL